MVGMQEFFYDQMPQKMKNLGVAIYLSVIGIGSILSGIIISVIQNLSCKKQGSCWISNNLNNGHLDHFYWFLAVLAAINFFIFIIVARYYEYKSNREVHETQEVEL